MSETTVYDYDLDDYTEYDENGPYFDPYDGCYDDEPSDLWGEEDDYEYWLQECGQVPGQGCLKAGSEECDFECPFAREGGEPGFDDSIPDRLLVRILAPVRNWWSDVKFRWRHCSKDYQAHAHWVRYAWGLEDDEYFPF